MEAELVSEVPEGGWRYEPKWDGFRGVLENDNGELALWSRNGRPLLRYFPELREVGDVLPPHSALDGEIVIARNGALDFDAMQMRLHPAESRGRKLSAEIPATFAAVGAKNQAEIAAKVLPLLDTKSDRRFSEPNRWGTDGLEEAPLKPELVVEVRFDKLEKHRFRHGTRLLRFRPDKDPAQCTWREVRPPRRASDLAVEDLLR